MLSEFSSTEVLTYDVFIWKFITIGITGIFFYVSHRNADLKT